MVLRLVLAADPAGVADLVEPAEQEVVVDLACSGLVAAGIVGDLHMGDAREQCLHRRREFALHALHVVDVVLQPEVGLADFVEQGERLAAAGQVEAGNVVAVDRFDEQLDPGPLQFAVAAKRKLPTSVCLISFSAASFGAIPTRQLSLSQPSALA